MAVLAVAVPVGLLVAVATRLSPRMVLRPYLGSGLAARPTKSRATRTSLCPRALDYTKGKGKAPQEKGKGSDEGDPKGHDKGTPKGGHRGDLKGPYKGKSRDKGKNNSERPP